LKHEEKRGVEEHQCSIETPCGSTEAGTSSVSSSDSGTSPFSASETNGSLKKKEQATKDKTQHSDVNISNSDSETVSPPANFSIQPWMSDFLQGASSRSLGKVPRKTRTATTDALLEKISKLGPCLDHSKIPSFFTLSPSHQFLAACMEH